MAKAKAKKTAPKKAKPAAKKKSPAKAKAKPRVETPEVSPSPEVVSQEAPRAERAIKVIECTQCHGEIDSGTLRITLEAGAALHPSCTFGWTLDHLPDNSATADWMARLMQRSRLTPEDRAELLVELDAPSA
jgi:hypothetical protein